MTLRYGKILHELRTKENLTQYELGIRAGVRDKLICGYENGYSIPSVERFEDLIDACGYELVIRKKGQ